MSSLSTQSQFTRNQREVQDTDYLSKWRLQLFLPPGSFFVLILFTVGMSLEGDYILPYLCTLLFQLCLCDLDKEIDETVPLKERTTLTVNIQTFIRDQFKGFSGARRPGLGIFGTSWRTFSPTSRFSGASIGWGLKLIQWPTRCSGGKEGSSSQVHMLEPWPSTMTKRTRKRKNDYEIWAKWLIESRDIRVLYTRLQEPSNVIPDRT